MIRVSPVSRSTVDAWPIPTSGLPARVVNSLRKQDLSSVGDIRKRLPREIVSIPGLGAQSRTHIRQFLDMCAEVEAGTLGFPSLDDLLAHFLSPIQIDTLALRYGLDRKDAPPPASGTTLEAIGEKYGRTRERMRQVEKDGKGRLRTCLAQVCLGGLYEHFERVLTAHGCAMTDQELAVEQHPILPARCNPSGLLRLLCDCAPGLTHRHGVFTTLPEHAIRTAESAALDLLREHGEPVTLARILDAIPAGMPHGDPNTRRHVVETLLRQSPEVQSTLDGRYFMSAAAAAHVLAEIAERLPRPVHFRAVLREFNALMLPASRRGAGFVLDGLAASHRFTRTTSGYYELAPA